MIEDAFRQQHLRSSLHFWTLFTITSQRTSTATQRQVHTGVRGCMDKERRDNVGFQSVRGQSVLGDDVFCYCIGKRLKLNMETENSGI